MITKLRLSLKTDPSLEYVQQTLSLGSKKKYRNKSSNVEILSAIFN